MKHEISMALFLSIILLATVSLVGNLSYRLVSTQLPHTQTAAVADFDSSLVAHYTFDDGTATDSSGKGNNGTPSGATAIGGKIGQGLKFDGVDDIVSTQNPALLSSGAVTVCAWINPLAWTNAQGLHFIISDSKFNFAAYKTSTDTRLYFTSNGSSRAFSATNSIDLNKWQHACVMRDISGRANIFVNGSLSGGADQNSGVPTPSGGWTTVIGANASKSDYFFDGLLDDVRVYGRVLSSEEIFSLAGNSVVSSGSGVDNQNQIETSSPNSPAEPASPIITDGKTLTVSKSGTGQGTITATGINCGNDCSEIYTTNSWIVLTPITPSGYGFAKWRGGVCETVDSANKCTVIMRNNLTVTPIFGILPTRSGNTLNAASCEMSDVQVAVNEARDGDIIKVPAGTCTWTTSLEIGSYSYASQKNTSKALTLEGAGADSTTIIDAIIPIANKVNSALIIYVESGKFVRVTGFSFDGTNSVKGYGALSISGPRGTGEVLFRIDHNAFPNLTYKGITVTSVYGLIDSNTFTPLYPYGTNGVSINGDDYSGRTSNISWSRAQQLGSDKAVYMENNKFLNSVSANGAFDAYTGARYVFRYNDVVGTHVGHHGFDSSVRGAVDFEIYNNTFSNPADALHRQAPLLVMAFRSGSGVVFNNFVTPPVGNPNLSGYSAFAALQSYRSLDFYKDTPEFICDGDSPWDGNSPDILDLNDNGLFDSGDQSSGYPCKDQIGRTGGFDAKGYQTLSPVYSWNNNFNGNIGGHLAVDDRWIPNHIIATRHILQGRDYFNGIPKPGYVPYSCPHPLTNLLGGCDSTKAGVSGYNIQGMSKSLPVVTTSDHSLPPHQITPTSTPLTGDFNRDGLVNTLDFSLLVSSWNQPSTTYDLNGDGLVNTLDYAIMAQHWSR